MAQMIMTATNDALVAAHIASITHTTGSALKGVSIAMLIEEAKRQMREGCCYYHDVLKGAPRSFRWANLIAVLS